MPEGPSIVILREEAAPLFEGQTILRAEGNTQALDVATLPGQKVLALRSWGKHFLIRLPTLALRIHFMMFGSYRINERKPGVAPRLGLGFARGRELNFYACSVKPLPPDLDVLYDWRTDVMADAWSPVLALRRLRALPPGTLVCDALLSQDIFAGVGNIIKNEVLFRIRMHPLSTVDALSAHKLRQLVKEARQYSFDFLAWKRAHVLRAHWLAHNKSVCPRCLIPFQRGYLGQTQRRSFWCERCQRLYGGAAG